METLDLNNKRKREKLTASEWNSLIDAINLLILRYNLGVTIPTKLSQLINDAGFITDISGKADKSDLARVATTGSYNDLKDKPDLSNIGSAGKSAYELAVENGYQGTIQLWLLSLKGQDGTNGTNGQDGTNGNDGITPHIDPTSKHWMIGETDTGVLAEGQNGQNGQDGLNGKNGTDGTDGITPHIDQTTGNWFIGNTNTGVHAQGPLGIQGETGALGSQGILGIQGPLGPTGTDGITPTISVTNISGGHNVAFNYGSGDSRNANFNVMDGSLADQVLVDWNQTDDTQVDYIKNKPNTYTKEEINKKLTSANYEYVDLGLPSRTLWAKCNVGATVETDRGNSYMFGSGSRQYNSSDPIFYGNGESELLSPNDTATQVMGLAWHMPSEAQYNELLANTTSTYIANFNDSGVGGIKFTSQNGAYVFFPYKQNNTSYGDYWSSTFASFDGLGRVFCFSGGDPYMANALSTHGSMVRGVILECPFSGVAYTGDYNDLVNKPKILTKRIEIEDVSNNYDYVEIGGIKWATKNVGATNVTDEGLYFLWGDIVGHPGVGRNSMGNGWTQYKYGDGTNNPSGSGMLKYNSVDGMTTLCFSDDGAKHYMGGGWKMPSKKDVITLYRNTTYLPVTNYQNSGVNGYLLTNITDNSKLLFFPKTWTYNADGSNGSSADSASFWTNELTENDARSAYEISMYDGEDHIRYYGSSSYRGGFCPIRAILDEETMSAVAYTGDYNYLANKPSFAKIWSGTQALYNALSPNYDSNTIYIIT